MVIWGIWKIDIVKEKFTELTRIVLNRLRHANEQLLNWVADKKHLPMFQTGVFASTPHRQKSLPSGNKTKRYNSEVLSETNQIEGANFNIKLVGGFNPIEK